MNIIKERYTTYNFMHKDEKLSKEVIDYILSNMNELGILDEINIDLENTPQFVKDKTAMIVYEYIFHLASLDVDFKKSLKKDFKHIIKSNIKWLETEATKYIYNSNRINFNIKEDLQSTYFIAIEYANYYNVANLLKSYLDNIDYQQAMFQVVNNYIYYILTTKFNTTVDQIKNNSDRFPCNDIDLVIFASSYFPLEYKKIKKIFSY